jgi:predicted nuclease of predicted toxin-antitoxin system
MRFKLDENMPVVVASMLRTSGHDAMTVVEQEMGGAPDGVLWKKCALEHRVLITLDHDFSDIRSYPPSESAGCIVLRPVRQDVGRIIDIMQRVLHLVDIEVLHQRLWVVDDKKVRIRS